MGQDCQPGRWTHRRFLPTALSLHEWPLCALQKAEQWANTEAVPANYLALLLLPGSPSPAGQRCSVCLMSDGLVPPLSGAGIWLILQAPLWLIKHKHLLGFWLACGRLQSGEGWRKGEGRERGVRGKGRLEQAFWRS